MRLTAPQVITLRVRLTVPALPLLLLQLPDAEKRKRADYVIDTGCSLQQTEQHVAELVQQLRNKRGTAAERMLAGSGSSANSVQQQQE